MPPTPFLSFVFLFTLILSYLTLPISHSSSNVSLSSFMSFRVHPYVMLCNTLTHVCTWPVFPPLPLMASPTPQRLCVSVCKFSRVSCLEMSELLRCSLYSVYTNIIPKNQQKRRDDGQIAEAELVDGKSL